MNGSTVGGTNLTSTLRTIHVYTTLFMMPFNIAFNGLLILAVIIFHRLHNMQNYLIAAITCFDLLLGMVMAPMYAVHWSPTFSTSIFDNSKYGCLGLTFVNMFVQLGHISFLQLLTLDRYLAVMHPLWHLTNVTFGNLYEYIVGVILLSISLIAALPFALDADDFAPGRCNFGTVLPDWYLVSFFYMSTVLGTVTPVILSSVMTVFVKRKQSMIKHEVSRFSNIDTIREFKAKVKSSRIAILIYYSYLIFYLPMLAAITVDMILGQARSGYTKSQPLLIFQYSAFTWVHGFMGVVQPLLMFYLKKKFLIAAKKLVKTPFWRLSELRFDKLGSIFNTGVPSTRGISAPTIHLTTSISVSHDYSMCMYGKRKQSTVSFQDQEPPNLSKKSEEDHHRSVDTSSSSPSVHTVTTSSLPISMSSSSSITNHLN